MNNPICVYLSVDRCGKTHELAPEVGNFSSIFIFIWWIFSIIKESLSLIASCQYRFRISKFSQILAQLSYRLSKFIVPKIKLTLGKKQYITCFCAVFVRGTIQVWGLSLPSQTIESKTPFLWIVHPNINPFFLPRFNKVGL